MPIHPGDFRNLMSSLAAVQADGFYYPPEWAPDKGSISKFVGSKGANQYEQKGIIRFELPYHCWCMGCGRHIGKGVRFNAKKEQAGNYFTTKIWEFHMKCPSCSHAFIIRTDPKNSDYEMVEGIKKKAMEYTAEDIEVQEIARGLDDASTSKVGIDPLVMLEKQKDDKQRALTQKERMEKLIDMKADTEGDYYAFNSLMRKNMRATRNEIKEREEESRKKGLGVTLLPRSEEDAKAAKRMSFVGARHTVFKNDAKSKMASIMNSSIFGGGGGGGGISSSIFGGEAKSSSSSGLHGKRTKESTDRQAVAVKKAKLGIDAKAFSLMGGGSKSSSSAPFKVKISKR